MTPHTVTITTAEPLGFVVTLEIAFHHSPAAADSNAPDALEFIAAKALDVALSETGRDALERWAESWLHGVGYEEAVARAREDSKS